MTQAQPSNLLDTACDLLCQLIATPSISREEGDTATLLQQWLNDKGVQANRQGNNVWALCKNYDASKPTLMLDAHHDTVKPSPAYTLPPFQPTCKDGKIYGLGSNDDGGSVVALTCVFLSLYAADLPFNLLLTLSAEEEVSGENGLRALLPHLESLGIKPTMAIAGEPTDMQPAIAERGLLVLDCVAHGITGHAARNEGVNALYKAIDDINRLRNFVFDKVSPTLGPIKLTVTQIEAGRQHNVVPESCKFVVDVRTTDAYTNEETARIIADAIEADATPRSFRIRASVIDEHHPLVRVAVEMGKTPYVSPTTSDMAVMPHIPSLKMGPGHSGRSHSADEFIYVEEIDSAISDYLKFIEILASKY